jgi:hypothetical protein
MQHDYGVGESDRRAMKHTKAQTLLAAIPASPEMAAWRQLIGCRVVNAVVENGHLVLLGHRDDRARVRLVVSLDGQRVTITVEGGRS